MKADFLRYHIEDLLSFLFENKINEKIKNISTHLLTVLIMSVILHIEQRKRNKKKSSESGVENVDNTQERSESA